MLDANQAGTVVYIYHNGVCVHSVDLAQVTEPYEFPIVDTDGTNIVRIEAGCICMVSADCPDQICVHMGWSTGQTIVCLPHRLVIQFEDHAFDGMAG